MFNSQLIEKFKKIPTPFYYYDLNLLEQNLQILQDLADSYGYKIHYAVKANAERRILEKISSFGLGADCVSGNEIKLALETGFSSHQIVFAGVGKTDREIRYALEKNIQCFNCESVQELEVIAAFARESGKIAPVALRLNPNIEANTHHHITTGRENDKFGIPMRDLEAAIKLLQRQNPLKLMGIHFHIGSQITDFSAFKNLSLKVNEIKKWFKEKEMNLPHLNLGGGLGVDYYHPDAHPVPDYGAYFKIFHENLEKSPGQEVHFELGRAIVAQCGALISRVLYLKQAGNINFAIIDAGMTELIRPALYGAYHKIENLTASGPEIPYDVAGPVCESSDFLGKTVRLPETRRGDILAIRTTGAYAQVMASRYNLRDPAAVVYSDQTG